jgi:hypothetical protein
MNPPTADEIICKAIAEKKLIAFDLNGQRRIAEPHDYGIRNGVLQLLAYQIAGGTRSGRLPAWRWVHLDKASHFEILDRSFAGGRGAPTGKHSQWDELFVRVEPAGRKAP